MTLAAVVSILDTFSDFYIYYPFKAAVTQQNYRATFVFNRSWLNNVSRTTY